MTPKLKPLSEQVIVITGASSGIGLVTARTAARRGARVLLVARDEAALVGIVDEIVADGGQAGFAVADVGDLEAVENAAAKAIERFGRIDTWVNDAGVTIYAKLMLTPPDEHERMFRTNYFGTVNGCLVAIGHLREAGGALITVGSIGSDIPIPIMGAYGATKHAIKGYIEALRIELAADRLPISVTLVKPSGIDTPIGEHAANHGEGEALIPPPVYDPQMVADTILDAAEHPRREVTVGRIGRAEVLFGQHFPRLFERLVPLIIPLLFDRSQPKTSQDTLFAPSDNGRERSRSIPYPVLGRHRLPRSAAAVGMIGALGIGFALLARRKRSAR